MVVAKCISKNRNNSGVIVSYTLMDQDGQKKVVTGKQIKEAMKEEKIMLTNLQIDKAGRLIDKTNKIYSDIYNAFVLWNLIRKELRWIKPSHSQDDLIVTTINKEYELNEKEKEKYKELIDIKDYKLYMDLFRNNIKEIKCRLGVFQFTQNYDKELQRTIDWYKGLERYKNYSEDRIMHMALEYAEAELRDEKKNLNERVPIAHEIIKKYKQQYDLKFEYEIIKGIVIIKL